ncbi:RHS repeat-associated core domain-containing protein [Trinickia sp. NRRL B-1857]|uniref:RHS repeat-associated core domain-containing protein n=1 Tax=Trinickia sp. NRRL B-1857 TaxID=3162879 RepID=UPI003D2E209B
MESVLRFAGRNQDPVSGGYPLGNGYRWYLPALMRFGAPDAWSPFGRGGVNPYTYCGCDPINFGDPTGHVLKILNALYVPEADQIHVETHLEVGLRLDKRIHGDMRGVAQAPNKVSSSKPSTSTAAVHAASSTKAPHSPEPLRTPPISGPTAGSPANVLAGPSIPPVSVDSSAAHFADAGPSTSAASSALPPGSPPPTFTSLYNAVLSRPLGGTEKQSVATRRTISFVDEMERKGVTVADLPDYPGMEETSRLFGYTVPLSTVRSNALKVIYRPDLSEAIKTPHVRTLTYFNELPADIAPYVADGQ